MLNQKRHGTRLEFRTFTGRDGNDYLVFRNPDGSFHTFVEVEAKGRAASAKRRRTMGPPPSQCGSPCGTELPRSRVWTRPSYPYLPPS